MIGLAWIAIGLKELNAYDGEDIGRLFPANVIQCSLKRFTHCLLVLFYYAAFLGDQSILESKAQGSQIWVLPKRTKPFGYPKGFGGGAGRDRTDDLYNAIVALSQLSYGPHM